MHQVVETEQQSTDRRSRHMITGNAGQSAKTRCPRGHAYTPENTKLAKSTKPGHFKRQCRACKSEVSKLARINAKLAKAGGKRQSRRGVSGDPR
jgi:hypothetical protein